jgi:Xaa-Pro dipeptidase
MSDHGDAIPPRSPELDLPFARAEFDQRLERLRAAMQEQGLALLYLTSPESIYYTTGFHSDWYQAQTPASRLPLTGVALPLDGEPLHVVHRDETELAAATTWGPELLALPVADPERTLLAELARRRWVTGTVGLELSSYRPSRAVSDLLCEGLAEAGAQTSDATELMRTVMRRKSPQELACHRIAASFGDIGLEAARQAIGVGVTEAEILGEMVHAMSAAGAESPSLSLAVFSGPKAAMLHSLPSRRRLLPGDIVNIDVAGVFNRYHSDAARTFVLGEPQEDVRRIVAASAEGFELLLGAVRPGRATAEVLAELTDHYAQAGLMDDIWWIGGYELPATFPPDWVGQFSFDALEPGDGVFEDNLVTNYESNFYLPRLQGVSLQIDTLLIDGEPELLHHTPRELLVVQ